MRRDRGFSLTGITFTVAVPATIAAVAFPVLPDWTRNIRLNDATGAVERRLHSLVANVASPFVTLIAITAARCNRSRTITINGAGKIHLR